MSRVSTLAWRAASSLSLLPSASTTSRRAMLVGLAASAAIPAPELANALCGPAAREPDRRDSELLSLYAAVLGQSDSYEQAERVHDRLCSMLRDQTVFAAPRHRDGDPVDGIAWWCGEEDGYVNYCHPGQIEDRRHHKFLGRAERDRFAEILAAQEPAQAISERLVARALEAGGRDNVTAVVALYRLP